jgi:hypothetical protein
MEEGTFTRAAERLHVTQPGLSHQFQALEREAGGLLLERLPRTVRLTQPAAPCSPTPGQPSPKPPAPPPPPAAPPAPLPASWT